MNAATVVPAPGPFVLAGRRLAAAVACILTKNQAGGSSMKRAGRLVGALVAIGATVSLGLVQNAGAAPQPLGRDPLGPPPVRPGPLPPLFPGAPGAPSPWQALTNQQPVYAGAMLLLTDGSVIVQSLETSVWWRLTPNAKGSYVDGTWSQIASLPNGYAPTYFASAVLPDGRVIIEGGEYNGTSRTEVWSNQGAIYNPLANTWTAVKPPTGSAWSRIGDASSTVLPNGKFMLNGCCSESAALLNENTLTWAATGTGKADSNNEEGLSLLPDGNVLTVDVNNGTSPRNSELYSPSYRQMDRCG